MKVKTKIFDEIELDGDRVIEFAGGIIGYPKLQRFALIFDEDSGVESGIKWLQSLDEPAFAMPVMDPLLMVESYNPSIEDELLKPLGEHLKENMLVLVTVTVPGDITRMSINLKAPIIINAANRKASQLIVEDEEYPVKYFIYEKLQAEKAGE